MSSYLLGIILAAPARATGEDAAKAPLVEADCRSRVFSPSATISVSSPRHRDGFSPFRAVAAKDVKAQRDGFRGNEDLKPRDAG